MRVVFVHGAFVHVGSWWWAPAAALLEQSAISSVAVALPSCGEAGPAPTGSGPGVMDDAAALIAVLDDGDAAVVVAHSYGGTVTAQGAMHPAVCHLVYISSFLPHIGDSHASLGTADSDPLPITANLDGSISVVDENPSAFTDRFLHDVPDGTLVHGAHERLCAQSPSAFTTPITRAAWQHIPSTYVVCSADCSTSPELQRTHAARATDTVELPTGHHPFLSRPELVADVVRQIAQRT